MFSRFSGRLGTGWTVALPLLAVGRGAEGQEVAPSFTFSVTCPEDIRVAPGASFERELEVVLDRFFEDLHTR